MAAVVEIHENGPPIESDPDGDGWAANLCLAWAQIVEGAATCDYCEEDARLVLANGADPDYVPMCWEHAAAMIDSNRRMSAQLFGGGV